MGVAVMPLRPRPLHSQLRLRGLMAATWASTSATALSFSIHSVLRGHHVNKKIWTPYVGEMLALQREIGNVHDRFAVAVTAQPAATIVGRVPRELSRYFWEFLNDGGKIVCEVTGKRRKGKGLEVPCVYRLSTQSEEKLQKLHKLLKRLYCVATLVSANR